LGEVGDDPVDLGAGERGELPLISFGRGVGLLQIAAITTMFSSLRVVAGSVWRQVSSMLPLVRAKPLPATIALGR
jgi:hypothetical protein